MVSGTCVLWILRYPLYEHGVLQSLGLIPVSQTLPLQSTVKEAWLAIISGKRLDPLFISFLELINHFISSIFIQKIQWPRPRRRGLFADAVSIFGVATAEIILGNIIKAPIRSFLYRYIARHALEAKGLSTEIVYGNLECGNLSSMVEVMIWQTAVSLVTLSAYAVMMVQLRRWMYPKKEKKHAAESTETLTNASSLWDLFTETGLR